MTQRCSRCGRNKPLADFHKQSNSTRKQKVQSYCKDCTREYTREYRLKNPRKMEQYDRDYQRQVKFNLEPGEYDLILDAQNYECAICKIDIDDVPKEFAVDHNHLTGKVRGLLCGHCNLGLGHFKDNIVSLQSAIEYLKRGEL